MSFVILYWAGVIVTGGACIFGLYQIWKTKTYTPIGFEHDAPATLGSFLLRIFLAMLATFVPIINSSLAIMIVFLAAYIAIAEKFGDRILKVLRRPL
ncbi:hypothetical protein [Xanthomonas phage X1]|nr:hypothetical protein [Xanthomonas phage X1]